MSVIRSYLFSNLDIYPLLIARLDMLSQKGLNLAVLSFIFHDQLPLSSPFPQSVLNILLWGVYEQSRHYKILEKQTINICSPKKRTLQNICSLKKRTLQNICSLKKRTLQNICSLKSGHHKTFVMKRAHTTFCCNKQRGHYKVLQSQKADTTNFANRSLTCVKAVSKYM